MAQNERPELSDALGSDELTHEMIDAGLDVLRDPQWSTAAAVEWFNERSWAGGSDLDTIVADIYRAMRTAASKSA